MLVLKPAKKKILFFSCVFMLLASICFFIEPLTNKITQGTHIIGIYEATFFYLFAIYYLLQLIPGYAKLTIDKLGFNETWFFRQRIKISWLSLDIEKSKQTGAGDTLYINSLNEQLFSRKIACKGTYSLSDNTIHQKFMGILKVYSPAGETNSNCYFVLGQTRKYLFVVFASIILVFNSYYLTNEKPDTDFIEQVMYWQQQGSTDQQLFESFKIYGFYWKTQLRQYDRKLFQRILLQESLQIEELILKRKEPMLELKRSRIKQQLTDCKDKYLYYDDEIYLQCVEKI